MGKHKDLRVFEKSQIVIARHLGQRIFKTATRGMSLVCRGQDLSKVVQGRKTVNGDSAMGGPGTLIHVGSEEVDQWKSVCRVWGQRPVRVPRYHSIPFRDQIESIPS